MRMIFICSSDVYNLLNIFHISLVKQTLVGSKTQKFSTKPSMVVKNTREHVRKRDEHTTQKTTLFVGRLIALL